MLIMNVVIVVIFLVVAAKKTDSPKSAEPEDSDSSTEQNDIWEQIKGFAGYLLNIALTCYISRYLLKFFFIHHFNRIIV